MTEPLSQMAQGGANKLRRLQFQTWNIVFNFCKRERNFSMPILFRAVTGKFISCAERLPSFSFPDCTMWLIKFQKNVFPRRSGFELLMVPSTTVSIESALIQETWTTLEFFQRWRDFHVNFTYIFKVNSNFPLKKIDIQVDIQTFIQLMSDKWSRQRMTLELFNDTLKAKGKFPIS